MHITRAFDRFAPYANSATQIFLGLLFAHTHNQPTPFPCAKTFSWCQIRETHVVSRVYIGAYLACLGIVNMLCRGFEFVVQAAPVERYWRRFVALRGDKLRCVKFRIRSGVNGVGLDV
jgi:hypothetical protein